MSKIPGIKKSKKVEEKVSDFNHVPTGSNVIVKRTVTASKSGSGLIDVDTNIDMVVISEIYAVGPEVRDRESYVVGRRCLLSRFVSGSKDANDPTVIEVLRVDLSNTKDVQVTLNLYDSSEITCFVDKK